MYDMRQDRIQEIAFEEAIAHSQYKVRHLLLGNGFSINVSPSFSYPSLFEAAKPFKPDVEELFKRLPTPDFEQVLDDIRLRRELSREPLWVEYEENVRTQFVQALSKVHPINSTFLSAQQCENCCRFLENFVGGRIDRKMLGRVYTTNYDLLLYWVVARSGKKLNCYDNFVGRPEGVWQPTNPPGLVYLHGGLHIFDNSTNHSMLRYDGQRSLIEQTRRELNHRRFPVIVAEGTSEGKCTRIHRNKYLKDMSRHFRNGLRGENAALFTYGHSLSERDAHILSYVGSSRIKTVYVGAFMGIAGDQFPAVLRWAEAWDAARLQTGQAPLEIFVYDTSKFSPWR